MQLICTGKEIHVKRLLVVEDEKKIRFLIKDFFEMKGYEVKEAGSGLEALHWVQQQDFDIIFLDIMMPGMDGMEVCREIRANMDIPILFLTAVYDEESKLKGYACGADDYITKPFSLELLFAKTEALCNRYRGNMNHKNLLHAKGLSIDVKRRVVIISGKEYTLAAKEFEILKFFVENKGQIITREQILDNVWGEEYFGYDRTVDTHIKKLRKAIGDAAKPLQTVYKAGYIWKE